MEQLKHKEFNKVIKFLLNIDEEFAVKFEEMQRLIPEKLLKKLHEFDEYKYTNKNYDYCFEIDNQNGFLFLSITHSNKTYLLKINDLYLDSFMYTLMAEKATLASLTMVEDDKIRKISFVAESWLDAKLKNGEPKVDSYITRYTADYLMGEEPNWQQGETKSFKTHEIADMLKSGHSV